MQHEIYCLKNKYIAEKLSKKKWGGEITSDECLPILGHENVKERFHTNLPKKIKVGCMIISDFLKIWYTGLYY